MAKTPRTAGGKTPRILNCVPSPEQINDWSFGAAVQAGVADKALLPNVDLREDWWTIGDQGDTGSCVGWAATDSVLRYHFTKAGWLDPEERLSVRFTWMASKEADEFTTAPTTFIEPEGTSLKSALDISRKYGAVLDEDLPFGGGPLSRLSAQAFYARAARLKIASYVNLGPSPLAWRRWLASNGPILTRLNVDETWFKAAADNPKLETYRPETAVGGHAVALVGYGPDGFIVRNSWGESWGEGGFAYASNAYAAAAFTEAYGVVLGGVARTFERVEARPAAAKAAMAARDALDRIEEVVLSAANALPGSPYFLTDPVGAALKDKRAFKEFLNRVAQGLRAGARLGRLSAEETRQLMGGYFDELVDWIRGRLSNGGDE